MTSFRYLYNVGFAAALISVAVQGCTKPKQTTAIGSGVGGAVGAGLGAIVGNQTGSAGAGVAIGAVAGAATGALIGNALQAQQETTRAQDEAIKRQERQLQAQRNELAELRSLKSDANYAATATTPRYRYRQMSVDVNSPEVAKRRAELQRRGPQPRGASRTLHPSSDFAAPSSRSTIARFNVRADNLEHYELAALPKSVPQKVAPEAKKNNNVVPKKVELTRETIEAAPIAQPIVEPALVAKAVDQPADSRKCKEAMSERELAMQAPENSDKLFHLRRALRLCPSSAPLHFELGKIYASMERTSNAEEEFKQALSLDPTMSAATTSLAELLKNETHF